jgi:hypothetical protein
MNSFNKATGDMTFRDCLVQQGESITSALRAAQVCGCRTCRRFAEVQAQNATKCCRDVAFERSWQAWSAYGGKAIRDGLWRNRVFTPGTRAPKLLAPDNGRNPKT